MRPLRSHVSVMHLAVYLVALIVGRMDDNGLAFFWPAAGVAALWMLRGRTRSQVVLDGTLLVAGTTVLDLVLGIDPVASVLFAAANLVVGVTVRLTSALLEKKSFWGRVPRRVATPRDLVGVGLASLAAALTSAVPGLLAVRVESGSVNWGTAAAWVVRNDCSTFVVVASVLAMLTTLFRAHAKHGWRATLTPEPRRFWAVELVWVVAISLGTAVFLFDSEEALPIAFILLVASTWIGYRFSPAVGGIYTTVFATLALLYTEQGLGPFSP
ncbi:MAG: hypothetical protein QOH68_1528, partial [Nocardioidaceae bacterium]|nr:hypothetical protein [Nocardioidaceae bacterium]